jgi:prevent-host-death family protein
MPTDTANQTIQASEAKVHFLRILDDVERGETIFITRHGKRIARIEPEVKTNAETVQQAFDQMRELRKRTGKMSLKEILSARDEGRR